MTDVFVIIPALNEDGTIYRLVTELCNVAPVQVIVVDNGSSDSTADEARRAGAIVIAEPRRGYGYACAAGVSRAREADIVAFMDADYSMLPSDLPAILAPIQEDRCDLVLGSRYLGFIAKGAMPFHQRYGNWLIARLMTSLYTISLTDIGPYRAIRNALLRDLNMQEMTYGWPAEMVVKSARAGARLCEVPVNFLPRQAGRSKVSGTLRGSIMATWFILGVTLRYASRAKG